MQTVVHLARIQVFWSSTEILTLSIRLTTIADLPGESTSTISINSAVLVNFLLFPSLSLFIYFLNTSDAGLIIGNEKTRLISNNSFWVNNWNENSLSFLFMENRIQKFPFISLKYIHNRIGESVVLLIFQTFFPFFAFEIVKAGKLFVSIFSIKIFNIERRLNSL